MDHRKVREAAARLRRALDALGKVERRGVELEKEILDACAFLKERQVKAMLAGMNVEELNRDKRGIRVAALKAAGYTDLAQLYQLSRGKLESIPGIGESSAYLIYKTLRQIADTLRASARIKLSTEDKSAEFARLIEKLYLYARLERPLMAARELSFDFAAQSEQALEECSSVTGVLGWLFSSRETKERAETAAQELLALAACGFTEKTAKVSAEFWRINALPAGDAMADFAASPARYAITLEFVSGVSGESGQRGDVPEELVQKVNRINPDLSLLSATLRPYQLFGTKYILSQGRCLLGDEMGLGKTMQAIAAMAALRAEGAERFLVVCPASVLVNWCREVAKSSALPVTEIHGGDKLDELYTWLKEGCVAVTTYETARSFALPEGFMLDMLIADEAHYVKNPGALRTRALKRLSASARRVLMMTGTPLENDVDEMCALLEMLDHDTAQKARELKYISNAPEFRSSIAPVYLRRTREDVLTELPDKIEEDQWCRPTLEDIKWYFAAIMAKNFMAMRRIGWHSADLNKASKAIRLKEILEEARMEGRKVLVFSFFRDTAEKVMRLAGERAFGPINGSVPSAKRQEIIDAFSAAPEGAVLMCQITAGGTGLNIQAASVVVFCEPQIKPSLETQAISRSYRMGQARSVLVYRLLCENTVDERIVDVLREKQELFDCFAEDSVAGHEGLEALESQQWIDQLIAEERLRLEQGG